MATGTCKVSVVVPVFNPGRYIDELLASLARQSLSADEFEAIFVDDGSTDGTPDRLESLAAETPNLRVIRIPASGGPGRPRNVGVDAARGEYVQFVDNDDYLGDEALERLWTFARANGSDVVIGKETRPATSHPMGWLFRTNRPVATLGNDPLLQLLTPHKLFRRDFLRESGIRFIEGPRRLIDHAFVVEAYFRARVISVLSDYACYYWMSPRPDRSNAAQRPHVWSEWFGDMRAVLNVVEKHTEPGPFRDALLARWYAAKGLKRIGDRLSSASEGRPLEFLTALRDLALERFPASVDEHVAPVLRIRSALLRAGEFDTIQALAAAERGLHLDYDLAPEADSDGRKALRVTASLAYRDGSPVRVERAGDRWRWKPPVPLCGAVPAEALDFTDELARARLEVVARHEGTGERVPLPGKTRPLRPESDDTLKIGASVVVPLLGTTMRGARSMRPGAWTLRLQLRACGWTVKTWRDAPRAHSASARPPEQLLRLEVDPTGDIALRSLGR